MIWLEVRERRAQQPDELFTNSMWLSAARTVDPQQPASTTRAQVVVVESFLVDFAGYAIDDIEHRLTSELGCKSELADKFAPGGL